MSDLEPFAVQCACPCGDGARPGHPNGGWCEEGRRFEARLRQMDEECMSAVAAQVGVASMSAERGYPSDVHDDPEVEAGRKPCGAMASASWCCGYHAEHSDDDYRKAQDQAIHSVNALRDVKNERDKAEREVERLQKVLAEHVNENLALHREVDQVHAENEQLRADIAKLTEDYGDLLIAKTASESSLAAANELLVRCRAGFDWNQYDNAEQNQIGRDLDDWHRAHLAAQPATALEFDDTVRVLCAVAKLHGWTLKSWGLQRYHDQEPAP